MHQFLDQLLNNPPAKKRTQTQTNSQIVKRNSQHQRLQQLIELERKDSQPGLYYSQPNKNSMNQQPNNSMSQGTNWKQPQDQSQQYEVEEITEQIVFQDDGAKTTAQKLQGFLPKVKQSLPQLQASHQQLQQEQEVLEVYSPQQYKHQQAEQHIIKFTNTNRNNYNHASNRRTSTQPQQVITNNWPSSKLMHSQVQKGNPSLRSVGDNDQRMSIINIRTVENLINGINNARECQMELMKWFELEKQCFDEFMSIVMVKIQLEVKRVLERAAGGNSSNDLRRQQIEQRVREQFRQSIKQQLTSTIRQQLQLQYQQKLQQQRQTIQSQLSYKLHSSQSSLNTQQKWEIEKKLIKEELQQRYQYRLQKLQLELEEQRRYSQELIKTYQDTHKPESIRSSMSNNVNGKGLSHVERGEELAFVKKQLQEKDKTLVELQIQIQRLNQHIFDVQQKVQGIELQVQNRVREKVKLLQIQHQKALLQTKNHHNSPKSYTQSPITQLNPILEHSSHLEQSSRLFGLQSTHPNHMHQQITELQLENQQLKKIIMNLEHQKNSIQQQVKQRDKIFIFREEQVKKNEQDIAYQWSQIDKQRQAILSRQQQLTTAQDNISRKISQIRTKQIDLDKWETQLQKRELALDLRQHEINQKLQEIVHQSNVQKEYQHTFNHKDHVIVRNQRESVSTNQNRHSRQNINDFNTQIPGAPGSFRPNGIDIPELPIGKKYDHNEPLVKHQKSFDHDFNYRSTKPQQILTKANFQKSFQDPDHSYSRPNRSRQRMIITSTNFRSNRLNNPNTHQFVLPPQTSKVQRHSRSKSRSKQKNMLRNNFVNGSSSISTTTYKNPSFKGKYIDDYYQNKQSSNLDGLGSKLQRLRDEIKREIDSIK